MGLTVSISRARLVVPVSVIKVAPFRTLSTSRTKGGLESEQKVERITFNFQLEGVNLTEFVSESNDADNVPVWGKLVDDVMAVTDLTLLAQLINNVFDTVKEGLQFGLRGKRLNERFKH